MACNCTTPYSRPAAPNGCFEQQFPVGMGYIPWQSWGQTYPLDRAFMAGTIFPALDYRFYYGRCKE